MDAHVTELFALIDEALLSSARGRSRYRPAVAHLAGLGAYVSVEAAGDVVEGTRRCLLYFLSNVAAAREDLHGEAPFDVDEVLQACDATALRALASHISTHPVLHRARTVA